jgi:hypothetical protein
VIRRRALYALLGLLAIGLGLNGINAQFGFEAVCNAFLLTFGFVTFYENKP